MSLIDPGLVLICRLLGSDFRAFRQFWDSYALPGNKPRSQHALTGPAQSLVAFDEHGTITGKHRPQKMA
jgi:hypothetical protein